jgi:hypothetical protein
LEDYLAAIEREAITSLRWRVRPQFYDNLKKQMDIIPIF